MEIAWVDFWEKTHSARTPVCNKLLETGSTWPNLKSTHPINRRGSLEQEDHLASWTSPKGPETILSRLWARAERQRRPCMPPISPLDISGVQLIPDLYRTWAEATRRATIKRHKTQIAMSSTSVLYCAIFFFFCDSVKEVSSSPYVTPILMSLPQAIY